MKLKLEVEGVGGGGAATRLAALQARILAAVAGRGMGQSGARSSDQAGR